MEGDISRHRSAKKSSFGPTEWSLNAPPIRLCLKLTSLQACPLCEHICGTVQTSSLDRFSPPGQENKLSPDQRQVRSSAAMSKTTMSCLLQTTKFKWVIVSERCFIITRVPLQQPSKTPGKKKSVLWMLKSLVWQKSWIILFKQCLLYNFSELWHK